MRIISLIISILFATFTAICAEQSEVVRFKELIWDFGTIEESGGDVSHRFQLENLGDTPIVVQNISASCGCTKPLYSRKPILQGEKGYIDISFDPMYRPGRFVKEIYVYISGVMEPIELKICGVVHERELSIEERFPFKVGDDIRIATLYATVRGVSPGESVMTAVEYTNLSDREITIDLEPRQKNKSLLVNYSSKIAAGQVLTMSVGYESKKSLKYGELLRDTLDIYIDGKLLSKQLYVIGRSSR